MVSVTYSLLNYLRGGSGTDMWRSNFLLVHVAPQDQSQVVRLSGKPLTNLPPPGTVTGLILTFLEYTKF